MAKPWERYGTPWQKYASPEKTAAPQPKSTAPSVASASMIPQGGMPWAEVGRSALQNLGPSGAQFAEDIAYPFLHPIETGKSLANLGLGLAEKVIPGEQEHEQYADALGEFFAERYGGMENLKRTMAEDPVGFLADASVVLTGGAATAAKVPGMTAKVSRAITHPVRTGGRLAAEAVGSLGTHTGGHSLRMAAAAGRKGGEAAKAFRGAITGATPMDDVVADARKAVAKLKERRGATYRQGMAAVAADTTVLDFKSIDRALAKASGVKKYKGITINKSTGAVQKEIDEVVNLWKSLDPAEYHTPEGMDALKQAIGDIRDKTPYDHPSRVVADQAYHAVKDEIVRQAPSYADTMKGYWQASELIKEIEKTLSLNPKAAVDTSLRKLQSVMRNNVNTNYGRRLALTDMLVEAGAEHLMEKLAGQSLTALAPRGLGRAVAGATGVGGLAYDPMLLATLPLQSPRLMGEAAYGLGRVSRAAPPPGTTAVTYQSGREGRSSALRAIPRLKPR